MHNTRRRRRVFLLLISAVIAGMLVACLPNPNNSMEQVRIAYLPIYVDLPLFVALDQKYFEKRGIKVETVRFETSPTMGTALVNKEVDAVASIAYSSALSIESRDPGRFKVFLVDAENPKDYLSAMVTMPATGIKRVEDLRNKRVGIFPGPTARTFFELVLKKHGLNPGVDVNIIELQSDLHIQTLVSGQVDALMTYEPIATQAVVEYGAIKFLSGAVESEIIDPWQAGVWLASSDFLNGRSDVAKKVVAALYEAVDYIRTNPQQAKQALNNYTGIKPEVAAKTPNIPFTKIGEINLEAFQRHADILREAGVISIRVDSRALLLDENFVHVNK